MYLLTNTDHFVITENQSVLRLIFYVSHCQLFCDRCFFFSFGNVNVICLKVNINSFHIDCVLKCCKYFVFHKDGVPSLSLSTVCLVEIYKLSLWCVITSCLKHLCFMWLLLNKQTLPSENCISMLFVVVFISNGKDVLHSLPI